MVPSAVQGIGRRRSHAIHSRRANARVTAYTVPVPARALCHAGFRVAGLLVFFLNRVLV